MDDSENTTPENEQVLGVDPTESPESPISKLSAALDQSEESQVLGQETEPEPAPEPEPEPQPEPEQEDKGLSQEELTTLQEKGRIFDMIDSNPELSGMIIDYMKAKQNPTPASEPASAAEPSNDQSEVAKLQKQVNDLQQFNSQLAARMEIQQFSASHPDFDSVKADVGKLLQKHPTYTLEEAYDLVKRTSGSQPPAAVPPSQPAEGRASREISVSNNRDTLREIKNPKVSFDKAFDLALEEAMRRQET